MDILQHLFSIILKHGLEQVRLESYDKKEHLSFQILTDIYKYGYETNLPFECFELALLEVEPFSQSVTSIMMDLNTDRETGELNSAFNRLNPNTWYLNLNVDVPYADGPLISLGIHDFDNSSVPYKLIIFKLLQHIKGSLNSK
jgi:hypothetical protein